MHKESIKLDKFAIIREAVEMGENTGAFNDATREQKRLLIKHLQVKDNCLDFSLRAEPCAMSESRIPCKISQDVKQS